MANHQDNLKEIIHIEDYGYRPASNIHGKTKCGHATKDYLHISDHPKKEHSAYRVLKLISMMPYCTKKEILWATGGHGAESSDRYWSDLHRRGYVMQFRTNDNLIVYAVTDRGEMFLDSAE